MHEKSDKREEAEQLQQWLDDLNESGLPIIVEGREDVAALKKLGFTNDILVLNSGPRYKLVEHIVANYPKVVILTDLDKEGKKLYGLLNAELSRFGIAIDHRFREFLQTTKLDQVEGLQTYCSRVFESGEHPHI